MNAIGFDHFALMEHVRRDQMMLATIIIENFPSDWTDRTHAQGYYKDDPVLTAIYRSNVGFKWSNVGELIEITERHREVLRAGASEGVADGYTVPLHIPGEPSALCSFAVKPGHAIRDRHFPSATYVAGYAFQAARRIRDKAHQRRSSEIAQREALTSRQLDCVILVGRGASDHTVAKALGIRDDTAHKHIEDAKRRYGVSTRMELVVSALYDGLISLRDIAPHPP